MLPPRCRDLDLGRLRERHLPSGPAGRQERVLGMSDSVLRLRRLGARGEDQERNATGYRGVHSDGSDDGEADFAVVRGGARNSRDCGRNYDINSTEGAGGGDDGALDDAVAFVTIGIEDLDGIRTRGLHEEGLTFDVPCTCWREPSSCLEEYLRIELASEALLGRGRLATVIKLLASAEGVVERTNIVHSGDVGSSWSRLVSRNRYCGDEAGDGGDDEDRELHFEQERRWKSWLNKDLDPRLNIM